jgi:hypothetical protein
LFSCILITLCIHPATALLRNHVFCHISQHFVTFHVFSTFHHIFSQFSNISHTFCMHPATALLRKRACCHTLHNFVCIFSTFCMHRQGGLFMLVWRICSLWMQCKGDATCQQRFARAPHLGRLSTQRTSITNKKHTCFAHSRQKLDEDISSTTYMSVKMCVSSTYSIIL